MRLFANCYIVLFLIDAGLSLTDELLTMFAAHLPALSMVRNFVAFQVIVLSLVVYFLLGLDRRLPKRVFLPLTLYAFWCSLALWPLLDLISRESQGLTAAFGQVFFGGVALITLRSSYGRNLLPADLFQRPLFGWRNTLVFSAVNLLLFPLLLVYSLMASSSYYLDRQTAGFMRVSPVGIYTSERSYHHAGKVVRLVAMMHVARKGYYQELFASLPAKGTIILAEGVTDQDRLLKGRFDYGRLANLVGLSSQDKMHLDGNLLELDDLERVDHLERDGTKPDIVHSDMDLNRFDPQTVEFLNVIARTLLGEKPLVQGFAAYNDWVKVHGTPEMISGVMDDILYKRNTVVIDALHRSLVHYDTVVVPWGGMHMPAIESALLERGFVPGDKKERLLFAFSAIPFAVLWKGGGGASP
ncbi:MAG: hypothetical protein EG822_02260 [Deltaproteobacteria bacterium]|nr:hypothetical protein [Deltaproteobacteria bacterium]TLN04276.1 MAG: hypothetical protein FDZ73_04160 [bacterium]